MAFGGTFTVSLITPRNHVIQYDLSSTYIKLTLVISNVSKNMSHALILGVIDKVTILACEILLLSIFCGSVVSSLWIFWDPQQWDPIHPYYSHTTPSPESLKIWEWGLRPSILREIGLGSRDSQRSNTNASENGSLFYKNRCQRNEKVFNVISL